MTATGTLHWRSEAFSRAFRDATGGNPRVKTKDYQPHGRLPVIDQGQEVIAGYVDDESLKCAVKLPCVLFGDHTKLFKFVDQPFVLGADGVKVLRPCDDLDPRFAFHFLRTVRLPDSVGYSRHFKFLKRVTVPIPPLDEQRRIARILDQADALRRKRREAIALTEDFLRSAFLELFGDPVTNPKGWPVKRLGEVATFAAGSSLPNGVRFSGQPDGHLLLKVAELNLPENEDLIVTARSWTPNGGPKSATCVRGAVVFPKRGGAIATNKKRLLSRPALLDPNLMAVEAKPKILSKYVLQQWFQQFDLASIASGSAVPQLNKQDLAPLRIAIPSSEMQQRFDSVCRSHRAQRVRLRRAALESESLFHSLVQRAFRGEL